jgi:hypothetical protein
VSDKPLGFLDDSTWSKFCRDCHVGQSSRRGETVVATHDFLAYHLAELDSAYQEGRPCKRPFLTQMSGRSINWIIWFRKCADHTLFAVDRD